MENPIHIISLGAGVQSSTMALMAAAGEITPMPVAAIFADTQAEPKSIYTWLDWLETQLPFPVFRVTAGNLAEVSKTVRVSKDGNLYTDSNIPVFIKSPIPGERAGLQSRQCTGDFKIDPIHKKMRQLASLEIKEYRRRKGSMLENPKPIIQWIGISRDEIMRMKPASPDFIENRWPLIEIGMFRFTCLQWMKDKGFPRPPRSACVFCPYHNDKEWRRLKEQEPEEFERAAQWESDYQASLARIVRVRGKPFLHSSCVPLREVIFSNGVENRQLNMFNNECEGMCGV
jgi:hypothetical protein